MSDPIDHLWTRFSDLRMVSQARHGQVYTGRNYQGVEVTVAVLSGPAVTDPAVRAAFADVVWRHSAGPGPGQAVVYAADLHADPPWAAVRGGVDAPAADQLLAELEQPSPDEPTAFTPVSPYPGISVTPVPPPFVHSPDSPPVPSSQHPPTVAPVPGPGRRPRTGVVLLGVALGVFGLLAVATVAVTLTRDGAQVDANALARPGLGGEERTQAPRSAPPSEPTEPTGDPGPVHPATGPDGPDGPVAGPTFGDAETTYLMELSRQEGFGFDFRTPLGWSCIGSANPNPGSERQVCVYDGGTFPMVEGGPGGILEVAPCPSPCGESQRETLRTLFPDPEAPWQEIDQDTLYAQTEPIDTDEGPKVGVYLSRVFAQAPGGAVDTHLTVRMRGHPEEVAVLQKIINGIYEVTSS